MYDDYTEISFIKIGVLSILIFSLVFIFFKSALEFSKIRSTKKICIVSVSNDKELSGGGGLFYCWIDTDEYVYFWVNNDGEYSREKYRINKTKIYEDAPSGEAYALLDLNVTGLVMRVRLHVPPGTIQRNINLE